MESKEFNVAVVKDFLMDARKALAKLENGDREVGYEADRVISGCIEELEGIVEEFEMGVEQEDEGPRVVRTMEELEDYLDDMGWSVYKDEDGWDIRQASPAGEDFGFFIRHGDDVEQAIKEIQEYAYDFDVDEHVRMWVEARNSGTSGVPRLSELVEDAKAIQEMLDELADGVNWCEQKTIGETLKEATQRSSNFECGEQKNTDLLID